jgi:hypothetical protein
LESTAQEGEGIETASPGSKTVRNTPHLGTLPALQATFPHSQGTIEVNYERREAA